MNRNTIHGIDLTAPGGLDALFAFNRARFGDAKMMADGDPAPADPAPADPAPAEPSNPAPVEPAAWDGKVESLPADVQKIITDLRTEAGDERVAKKTLAAIQKALDPNASEESKPDPAKLAEQLTTTQTEAQQVRAENAVLRTASRVGADPDALLDSRGFLAKLKDTDPTDTAAITALVEAAVKDNPKFRLARAADRNGTDFNGGSGEGSKSSTPVPLHQAVSGHYGSR